METRQLTAPRLLTTREVAETLRISIWRVHDLAANGVLEPIRLGERGHFRFRSEDIERLIAGEGKSP
jgi:excisionase family DNA binding protein